MKESIAFRLKLARGFLDEAQQDFSLRRWRATVSHAQLAVENALKALIGVFLPVPKTHDPARVLLELIARQRIPPRWAMARATVSRNGSVTRSVALGADGLWRPSR